MKRQQILLKLNVNQSRFAQLLSETGIEDKSEYSPNECQALQDAWSRQNSGNTSALKQPPQRPQPTTNAIAVQNQNAAGTIRKVVAQNNQAIDSLAAQRQLLTDHLSAELAAIIDPASIQEEIALKTLAKLEGKEADPFEVIDISAELISRPRFAIPGAIQYRLQAG